MKWTQFKSIIRSYEQRDGMYLSLINEEGTIVCANARMMKELHLGHPRKEKVSFYDLVNPSQLNCFRKAIKEAGECHQPAMTEVYLKNGYYHPMKWEVNYVPGNQHTDPAYLCVGYKIIDDARMKKFNELGEKNYQLIVEGLSAGILFQDTKGELIAVNQKAAEIFDATLERLYQLTDIEQLWNTAWDITGTNGEKVQFHDTPFMQAIHTGETKTEVLLIRLRSGDYRWLRFSSQPLFEDGSTIPYSVVSNIVDITHEKSLGDELKERDAVLNSFMGQTPNLAWVVDEDADLIFASQSFFRYFGLNPKSSIGKKLTDLVPGVVAKNMYARHIEVFQTGKQAELVEEMRFADGKIFVFHINIFPIEGGVGKKKVGGHAVNLSEKYATEKRLKEVNDRLLLLTRATTDAIWEWDMQTGYIFRNDALMDMIGYHSDDPKGLSWWLRRIHPEDRNRVSDKVKESTEQNKQSWEEEYRFKCADGEYKHMRDKGYIVYENGLPVKMIGSLQDITSLRDLESQLMEEKLQRQKEISETVIRVQEMERTRIGHELHDNVNQILSTTKLFVDMLTPASKQEKEFKKKSIDYIMQAIEEIRQLSKELVVPQLADKGLVGSISIMIEDIEMSTQLKIKFTHDLDYGMLSPGVQVTFLRIAQEQLKNIIKHSRAKKVDIVLMTKNNEAKLIIKDDGTGFDSGQTYRGIGLSNIFERTRFYNGTAGIDTAPGKGCTLSISIPLV